MRVMRVMCTCLLSVVHSNRSSCFQRSHDKIAIYLITTIPTVKTPVTRISYDRKEEMIVGPYARLCFAVHLQKVWFKRDLKGSTYFLLDRSSILIDLPFRASLRGRLTPHG